MGIFKKMQKYIAGFRSGNPANKKKAAIYYSIVAIMLLGTSWKLSDFAIIGTLLIGPSVFYNFKSMKKDKKGCKKGFVASLAAFLVAFFLIGTGNTEVTTNKEVAINNSSTVVKEEATLEKTEDVKVPLATEEQKEKEDTNKTENKEGNNESSSGIVDTKVEDKVDSATASNSLIKPEIHFINTGNSDAILIKQGNKAALIDGGDNDDEQLVVSYIKNQGISELEYVFATHPHADHIGGLDAVISSLHVKNVFVSNGNSDTATYSDFINAIANKGLYPSVPLLNSEFKLGTGTFKVLSVANSSDLNNTSIVLLYTNGEDKVLLMGDAESDIERNLNIGKVDLVKIGHHGSSTSSSQSFIDKLSPKYAVITVGKNNKYGHPSAETMKTLKNKNIHTCRTDECGTIVFKSTGSGLITDCAAGSYTPGNSLSASSNSNSSSISNNSSTSSNSTTASNSATSNSSSASNGSTTSNSSGTSSGSSNPGTSSSSSSVTTQVPSTSTKGVVYWTPKGSSYHRTDKCSTLSRSKTILSGTQAESGKTDPCNRCH